MSVDNINQILPFINPQNDDDFYFMQILKRKKENPEIGSNSIVIGTFYIKSKEHLLKVYEDVKAICIATNSRAMFQLNKRSFRTVAFKTLSNISNSFENGDFTHIYNQYDRAVGQTNADNEKKWIVDIDEPMSELDYDNFLGFISGLQPIGDKFLANIPSKNGFHIITKPFNKEQFHKIYPQVDIQTNNPTNLFIP